ncbi:MAG: hypothetical protein JWQ25_2950, partial [Daejeonella sp.]|nr:hypothetical protein [Daejeonella sp.]
MKTNKLSNQLLVIVILVIITSCERAEVTPDLKLKGNVVETLADEEETGIVHAGSVRGSLDGPALQAQFDSPVFLAVGPDNSIYVYDAGRHFEIGFNDQNRKIRKISTSGIVTTVFDLTVAGFTDGIGGMAIGKDGSIYISHQNQIKKI